MLTYCGLLDDFAVRHHDVAITSVAGLNDHLITAALFGDRLAINDGYLLVHEALREAVVQPEQSPLRPLVEAGFVRILTRNRGRLGALADEMAQDGITSAQLLLALDRFTFELRPALEQWSTRLRSPAFDAFVGWPNIRVDDVFRSVGDSAFAALHAARPVDADELDRFRDRLGRTAARRTDWENVADTLVAAGLMSRPVHDELMQTAAEAYHYAWGCALGAGGDPVRVLTRAPRYLAGISQPLGPVTGSPRPPVQLLIPDLNFAQHAVAARWHLLAQMVLPGHEIHQLKRAFLATLEQYYAAPQGDDRAVRAAADAYTRALSRHFADPAMVPVVFDLGVLAASTATGTAVGGPLGTVVGLGIGLAGVAAAHVGGPKFFWRLTAPATHGWLRETVMPPSAPASSCFQLDVGEVRRHTAGAKPFR